MADGPGLVWGLGAVPPILAILGALGLAALTVAGAEALAGASRARLRRLEALGVARARLVTRILNDRDAAVTALAATRIAALLGAAMIAADGAPGPGARVAALGLLALAAIILGEALPRSLARADPDRLALALAPGLLILIQVLGPLARLANALARRAPGLVGARIAPPPAASTARAELMGALDQHVPAEPGVGTEDERTMLGRVLDLDEVEIGSVMRHRKAMVVLNADAPPAEIVARALASPYTRLPLWRGHGENIIGVLHAKDLLRALHARGGRVEDLDVVALAKPPWFVPETTTLREQLDAFRQRRVHFALVVDEYGALMGLVTLEDVLEEIVGEIQDEHDIVPVGVRPQGEGVFVIDGWTPIRDLNRDLRWSLPDDEATTLAGLVIHAAQIIPDVGQSFSFYGFRFDVLARQRNQITLIRVTAPGRTRRPADAGDGPGPAMV